MFIAKNLQYLRKKNKITQEELAERLGVSRQSVSKWETGEAYPETEKLLNLCDMFGVTLDGLMRSDLTETADSPEPEICEKADRAEIVKHFAPFSKAMSAGVFLLLLGVAVCIALAGYSTTLSGTGSQIAGIMSGVAVIVFVAVAVFLFIMYGTEHERFKKQNPVLNGVFGEEEIKAFSKKCAVAMSCLVSGILIDVVFLIVMTSLIDSGVIASSDKDSAILYVTSAFVGILAFIIAGLTYFGIMHSAYNIDEYNKDNSASPRKKLVDSLCGAIMLGATAIFLVLGFVWGLWHPGWVVFPVGGIICAIVSTICNRD